MVGHIRSAGIFFALGIGLEIATVAALLHSSRSAAGSEPAAISKCIWSRYDVEGCPHGEPAIERAQRVIRATGAEAEVRRVSVVDSEAAVSQRFLGSPTHLR